MNTSSDSVLKCCLHRVDSSIVPLSRSAVARHGLGAPFPARSRIVQISEAWDPSDKWESACGRTYARPHAREKHRGLETGANMRKRGVTFNRAECQGRRRGLDGGRG